MYPQLVLSLDAVEAATRSIVRRHAARGIAVCGVTKAVDGEPLVGRAMLAGGACGLADSRLPALERLAAAGLGPLTLIRPPQPEEVARCATAADRVLVADPATANALGESRLEADADRPLEVLLTVDLGDRREGVLPEDAADTAEALAVTLGIRLRGVAVNFACLSGQLPSATLFRDAEDVLALIAVHCEGDPVLSLGGTCCLQHTGGYEPRFAGATEIRSGGGPLYGYDFVSGAPLEGLERRDPVLTAVVLECFRKPPAPAGAAGFDAFGHVPDVHLPESDAWYALLDIGRRDCEPSGLRCLEPGAALAGATSDVAVLIVEQPLAPGDTVDFAVDYDALVRAVTSPFVEKIFAGAPHAARPRDQERDA